MDNTKTNFAFNPLGGDKWFPKETWFENDMQEYWGEWGVSSEYDTLKVVLMHRPGPEIDDFDFREVRFRTQVDPERFRAQHDALADFYRIMGSLYVTLKISEQTDLMQYSAETCF